MSKTRERIEALERATNTNGLSVVFPETAETVKVVIHDGSEPAREVIMTLAEYDAWKRTRAGDWVTIVVRYDE